MTVVLPAPVQPDAETERRETSTVLSVAGLFAGIGGIELGLAGAGHRTVELCEVWEPARAVLKHQFPSVDLVGDVRVLSSLPDVDLVTAGFPCQDLSQAGRTRGITGSQSSLVENVFRLLDQPSRSPTWVLFENVPFMLHLDRGNAMRYLVSELEKRGYAWAYRVVDARALGLPQRRQRVLMLASKVADPREVLFAESHDPREPDASATAFGFYWTEGLTGLGWAVDAVPTLKGGSAIGIPSPPAIWFPSAGFVGTPDLRDAERLQGFDEGWTEAAQDLPRGPGLRWKLVGNAVNVRMARWLGDQLAAPGSFTAAVTPRDPARPWPKAAWGAQGQSYEVMVSTWPRSVPSPRIAEFLEFPVKALSAKAIAGFLERAGRSSLHFPEGFLDSLRSYAAGLAEPLAPAYESPASG